MVTRILVPVDSSPASNAALTYARMLAHRFGASLHLLHVGENLFLRAGSADPRSLDAGARRGLNDRLTEPERLRGATATVTRSDDAASEIVAHAHSADIDLIVMGTHGRTGLAHAVMGSVAEAVVRSAPCPVLTVRSAA